MLSNFIRIIRLIFLLVTIVFLEYCEVAVPNPEYGIPEVKYKAVAQCYYNDSIADLCSSNSGYLVTLTQSETIIGYNMNFRFSDFNIGFKLYMEPPDYQISSYEFPADSNLIEIEISPQKINYEKITGTLRITEYTRICIDENELFCNYYIAPRGVFELNFIDYGEDNIEGSYDDRIFILEKGFFYPE